MERLMNGINRKENKRRNNKKSEKYVIKSQKRKREPKQTRTVFEKRIAFEN